MANEFVARRGIIAHSGGAKITGSLLVSGAIDATGYTVTAQSFTGSILANNGVVSGAAQVQALLPNGTFSSSAQYPGLVTSSTQIDYNSIQNKLSGVVSSSAQVQPLLPSGTVSSSTQVTANLPGGTVSSSTQFRTLTDPFTGSFTGSFTGDGSNLTGIATVLAFSGSTSGTDTLNLKTEALVFSGSNGLSSTVTNNTVTFGLPAGTVTASSQIVVQNTTGIGALATTGSNTFIGNQVISGSLTTTADTMTFNGSMIVSGTLSTTGSVNNINGGFTGSFKGDGSQLTGVTAAGTVSASSQIDITQTTGYSTFSSSLATIDAGQTARIDNLASQTSSYAINATIQSQLAGVVSSSAQVKPLLPGGTVTSSAQYPGWVTASSQILLNSVTGTTFSNASFLFPQNLTVAGTLVAQEFYTEYVSGSVIYESGSTKFGDSSDDVMSVTGSIRVLGGNISGSFIGLVSQSAQIDYNSIQNKLSGVVSSSAQVQPLLPGGTVSSSAQYPGWVTASSQIDFGQVVNKNGVVSSSTQFKTLTDPFTGSFTGSFKGDGSQLTNIGAAALPPGTVSSSAQYPGWVTSSTQIVWSSVNYNTGIVSSSAQVQPLLPGGTVSSSGQVSITATTGYSTFSSSIATKNDLQDVSINALNAATSSYAINSTIQSQLAGVVSSSAQVKPLLPAGTVTSSAQYPGWVTASSQVLLNSVTGTTFSNASFLFPQDLVVAGNLTAQQFYTEFVSASVIYESGSTKFGDSADDVMSVTGSIRVLGGNISGSFVGLVSQSAQIDYNNIQNKLSGVVSSSAQVQPLLPNGTVSSSAQYPGWVTSSAQINFTQIQNIAGIVSSSTQFKTLTDPFTGSFTGSFTGDGSNLTGIATVLAFSGSTSGTDTLNLKTEALVFSGSNGMTATVTNNTVTIAAPAGNISASSQVDYNNIQNKLSGVVSSSAQVQPLLPNGTVSSSAQYPGWVTASSQIDYNSIQNKLSGVVSSSTQVQPLLPGGTVSSSAQYPGWITASSQVLLNSVTGTTFSNASFLFPQNLVVAGTLVAQEFYTEYVSGSVIYESGSTKFGDSADDVMSVTGSIRVLGGNISGSFVGLVSQSAQIDYNNIQNKLSGVVSSSAQVQPLLPAGTVSSSAQYPGWITSSTQVVWSSVNYNSGIVSSSTQVQPLLPAGTISSSTQFKTITDPFTGSFTGSFAGTHTGTFPYNSLTGIPSGIVSSSTQVQPLLPGGTVSSSAQYPGWVTSSTQIDYNSIQNKLSGVISSSTQFNALSGTSASFATTASAATSITFTPVTSSYAITASYAANAGGLAGVVSSSTQFKTLTDPFTGSFTGSFKGDGSQLTGLQLLSSSVVIDTHTFVGNGVTLNYTLPKVYEASSIIVSVEGLTQTITEDYTLSSTTLSFVSAPPSQSNILVRGFVNVVNNATGSFSGSFQGVVTSASYALTASYAANAGGLAGVISSSTQFKTLTDPFTGSFTGSFKGDGSQLTNIGAAALPAGTVSSSAQYPGWVTASSQILLNSVTGTTFSNASFLFPQNLKVEGTLTAQEFYTEFVSASVIYESGSTKFGNSADDVMSVTGSIQVLGGINATTTVSASTNAFINNTIYSGSIVTGIVGPVTNQVVATIPAASCDGVFFDYVVKDGTNYRTGTVMVVSSGAAVEFTDTSTSDIGNTAQAIFNVDIVGGIIRLKFTNTSGTWTVKTTVRAL